MEILEILSSRDLTANPPSTSPGAYSYQIDRHQFISAYSSRQHGEGARAALLGLTTTASQQIWISDQESAQVAAAVRASKPAIALDPANARS